MLSYRHSYHAGNFADVHKHSVLTLLLGYLTRKDTPLCYIDTHSGAGRYDFNNKAALKGREYQDGIFRLLSAQGDAPKPIGDYLDLVRAFNASPKIQFYPGSPSIAAALLRPKDRLVLTELHTSDYPLLAQLFRRDRRVNTYNQDGFQSLKAFIPPKERRGLVLIDPAYELAGELERVAQEVIQAHRKWPTGCYAVWYPILLRPTIEQFERDMVNSGIRKILTCEICLHQDDVPKRLNGSGMLIINPPWRSDEQLAILQPWLLKTLQRENQGVQRVKWLVEE